jgi:uncharacterized membrane protein (UPF0127 family)
MGSIRPVLLALLVIACSSAAPESSLRRVDVTIRDARVRSEVAQTPGERRQGLSGRAGLARDAGMLFVFERPGIYPFWMPDMHFDLDLVWIRQDRIVGISRNVSRLDPLREHAPPLPVDRVLEVVAGTAARHGWRREDRVEFDPPLGP